MTRTRTLNVTDDQRLILRRAMLAEVKRIQRELEYAGYGAGVREAIQVRLDEAKATLNLLRSARS
jgi:hypothetical protein